MLLLVWDVTSYARRVLAPTLARQEVTEGTKSVAQRSWSHCDVNGQNKYDLLCQRQHCYALKSTENNSGKTVSWLLRTRAIAQSSERSKVNNKGSDACLGLTSVIHRGILKNNFIQCIPGKQCCLEKPGLLLKGLGKT